MPATTLGFPTTPILQLRLRTRQKKQMRSTRWKGGHIFPRQVHQAVIIKVQVDLQRVARRKPFASETVGSPPDHLLPLPVTCCLHLFLQQPQCQVLLHCPSTKSRCSASPTLRTPSSASLFAQVASQTIHPYRQLDLLLIFCVSVSACSGPFAPAHLRQMPKSQM